MSRFPTYRGGSGNDDAYGIAVDVVRSASGSFLGLTLPVSSSTNAFLVELNPAGDNLQYQKILDPTASNPQTGTAVAVTAQGIAYTAVNVQETFPENQANIYQTLPTGSTSAYETLPYSISAYATGTAIVANEQYVYLAGTVKGSPVSPTGTYQTSNAGGTDAFVYRAPGVQTQGQPTKFTYLGGSGNDGATGIALPGVGGPVYVTGSTSSSNFPTSTGAYQTSLAGTTSAFVTELTSNLMGLFHSTYLGGSGTGGMGTQSGAAIVVNPQYGLITVVGSTTASNFPTVNGIGSYGGGTDAFVSQFSGSTLGSLNYSSFLAGPTHYGFSILHSPTKTSSRNPVSRAAA